MKKVFFKNVLKKYKKQNPAQNESPNTTNRIIIGSLVKKTFYQRIEKI
jgi:hypothetical protein